MFSQGVSRLDVAALTGPGIVSSAVNLASRLLESAQLRQDLEQADDQVQ